MRHLHLILLITFTYGFFGTTEAQGVLKVIVLRHAEKPAQGDNLSCSGMDRALKLPAVIVSKFGVPGSLYVPTPQTGKTTKSLRMLQTITPLAVKYGLPVNTNYAEEETGKLATDILQRSGTVVVVWEHQHIPDIITALGVHPSFAKWDGDDYDSIWIVTIRGGKSILTRTVQGIHPASGCPF